MLYDQGWQNHSSRHFWIFSSRDYRVNLTALVLQIGAHRDIYFALLGFYSLKLIVSAYLEPVRLFQFRAGFRVFTLFYFLFLDFSFQHFKVTACGCINFGILGLEIFRNLIIIYLDNLIIFLFKGSWGYSSGWPDWFGTQGLFYLAQSVP